MKVAGIFISRLFTRLMKRLKHLKQMKHLVHSERVKESEAAEHAK